MFDEDRHCPRCHGTKRLIDTATHDYAYNARSYTPCDMCAAPVAPAAPIIGPDAAIDAHFAAIGQSRAEWAAASFAEYWGEA